MQPLSLSDSVRLPEPRAIERHLDDHNWRILRWLLALALPAGMIGAIASFHADRPVPSIAWGVGVLAAVVILLTRRTRPFERHFREILIAYLLSQLGVLLVIGPAWGFGYASGGYLLPLGLLLFRLRRLELAALLAICLGVAFWFVLRGAGGTPPSQSAQLGMGLGAAAFVLLVFSTAGRLTRRSVGAFLRSWHAERARTREQARMREELDDARQIQLSMLPHAAPRLAWLELASASLPATEVGGDYFDYVALDRERLAIVVGDVAGHGVASGLLLASIRGGLHLLREELVPPARALSRLDRMVREIAPGRMYVTLQIAILDHAERRLTVVSAGHPPVLHYSAERAEVAEVGGPATPLGTRLESRLVEHSVDLGPGDVLLFYSDGVPEAADIHAEPFGDRRLATALSRSATGHSASEVRSGILDSVNRFKGDAELIDDLTIVVAKISG